MSSKGRLTALLLAGSVLVMGGTAHADFVASASGTSFAGDPISATADFSLSGTTLTLVLTDTSLTNTAYHNPDLLTGIFFNITGNPTLTPISATLTSLSTIVNASNCSVGCSTTNVGGEFAFLFSGSGFSGNTTLATLDYGISSAGYSNLSPSFGDGNFNGSNLDGPTAVDGLNFGLVGTDYNNTTATMDLQSLPLIEDSVTFKFTVPDGFTLAQLMDVIFTYGTNPDSVCIPGAPGCGQNPPPRVPEPNSLAIMGFGLVILGWLFSRRAKTSRLRAKWVA